MKKTKARVWARRRERCSATWLYHYTVIICEVMRMVAAAAAAAVVHCSKWDLSETKDKSLCTKKVDMLINGKLMPLEPWNATQRIPFSPLTFLPWPSWHYHCHHHYCLHLHRQRHPANKICNTAVIFRANTHTSLHSKCLLNTVCVRCVQININKEAVINNENSVYHLGRQRNGLANALLELCVQPGDYY